jgi:hypothetical protein
MTHVYDNQLRADDGTVLATFKSHWQAVAAMIRLSNPNFVSLGVTLQKRWPLRQGFGNV